MLMNNKFKAQTLIGNPTGNYLCQLFVSRALNMSCYFSQSAHSIESRCVVNIPTGQIAKGMRIRETAIAGTPAFRNDWWMHGSYLIHVWTTYWLIGCSINSFLYFIKCGPCICDWLESHLRNNEWRVFINNCLIFPAETANDTDCLIYVIGNP